MSRRKGNFIQGVAHEVDTRQGQPRAGTGRKANNRKGRPRVEKKGGTFKNYGFRGSGLCTGTN